MLIDAIWRMDTTESLKLSNKSIILRKSRKKKSKIQAQKSKFEINARALIRENTVFSSVVCYMTSLFKQFQFSAQVNPQFQLSDVTNQLWVSIHGKSEVQVLQDSQVVSQHMTFVTQ